MTFRLEMTSDAGEKMTASVGSADRLLINLNPPLVLMPIETFPRRGRSIRVETRDDLTEGRPRRVFVIPNPVSGPFPVWKPERMPASRKSGPLEVELVAFGPEWGQWWDSSADTHLDLRLRCGGHPVEADWEVVAVSLADETGNHWKFSPTNWGRENNGLRVDIGDVLPQGTYRVAISLVRSSHFPAEDLCTFGPFPALRPNQTLRMARTVSRHGRFLTMTGLIGTEAPTFSHKGWRPEATVCVSPHGDQFRFSILSGDPAGGDLIDENNQYRVRLKTNHHGQPQNLHLALTPVRTVEFVVHTDPPPTHRER